MHLSSSFFHVVPATLSAERPTAIVKACPVQKAASSLPTPTPIIINKHQLVSRVCEDKCSTLQVVLYLKVPTAEFVAASSSSLGMEFGVSSIRE